MNINMPVDPQFNKYYQKHLKCLKLNRLQPKTLEASNTRNNARLAVNQYVGQQL